MDSWPLKVTFLTCKYFLSTKGHAKEHYDQLSVLSRSSSRPMPIHFKKEALHIYSVLLTDEVDS